MNLEMEIRTSTHIYSAECSLWIPNLFVGIHNSFCLKKQICDNHHPYSKDGQLIMQVAITKMKCSIDDEEESNKILRTVGQWQYVYEPDFMENLDVNFVAKFVYLNPFDLLISGIEGFMPVHLISNDVNAVFIAVPYEDLQAGVICIYEEALSEQFPISKDVSLIEVRKLEDVRLARQLILEGNLSGNEEELTVYHNLKKSYSCANSFGNPFLLKSESEVKLRDAKNSEKMVKVSVLEGMRSPNCSDPQKKENSVSFPTTPKVINKIVLNASPCNSVDQLNAKLSNLELSVIQDISARNESTNTSTKNEVISTSVRHGSANISARSETTSISARKESTNISAKNESINTSARNESITTSARNESTNTITNDTSTFLTSTPVKKGRKPITKSRSSRRQKLKSKGESKTTFDDAFQQHHINYWISNETKIHIGGSGASQLVKQEEKNNQVFQSNMAYANLRNIIEKKITNFKSDKQCRSSWAGILLSGLPGTGKTLAIRELSSDLSISAITVSLLGWSKSTSPNYINECFDQAIKSAPSILVFDEVEALCLCREDFCDKILKVFHELKMVATPIILIGITSRPAAIPSRLKRRGIFDREVIMDIPDKDERTTIVASKQRQLGGEELHSVLEGALGFTGADLDTAVRIGWQKAVRKAKNRIAKDDSDTNSQTTENNKTSQSFSLQLEDLREGVEAVVPSSLRQHFSAVPKVCWSDIWGYDSVKDKLKKLVGENYLKGILLYGPPGCSKTMLVRALATETRFTFFPIKCSDLLSKYVGETEKCLSRFFDTALQSCPALIFMDEIDSLCAERSGGGNDGGIVSELLTILRRCSTKGKILVVGATNRPQAVDQALLSSGYLNELLHVDLPDCAARCSVWNGLLKQVPVCDVNVLDLCSRTDGFSCAEICNAYQRGIQDLLELLHSGSVDIKELKLTGEGLSKVLFTMSPQTPQSVLSDIADFKSRLL